MNKTEMRQFFDDAFKKVVLPELKEIRAELAKIRETQNGFHNQMDFLFKQYEKLEIEYMAIKQALGRIERKLESSDKSRVKLENEVKSLKGQLKILQQQVVQLEKELKAL